MESKVILRRSSVPGKVPAPADMELGELALNTADGRLFSKKTDDSVVEMSISGDEIQSDISAAPGARKVLNSVIMEPAKYNALASKDNSTIYYVVDNTRLRRTYLGENLIAEIDDTITIDDTDPFNDGSLIFATHVEDENTYVGGYTMTIYKESNRGSMPDFTDAAPTKFGKGLNVSAATDKGIALAAGLTADDMNGTAGGLTGYPITVSFFRKFEHDFNFDNFDVDVACQFRYDGPNNSFNGGWAIGSLQNNEEYGASICYQSAISYTDNLGSAKSNRALCTSRWNDSVKDRASYVANTWIHVAATFEMDGVTLYIDGESHGKTTLPRTPDDFSTLSGHMNIAIGAQVKTTDGTMKLHSKQGSIDQVMIFNRKLSDAEIKAIRDISA